MAVNESAGFAGEAGGPEVSESAVRAAADIRVVVSRLRRRMRSLSEESTLPAAQTSVLARLDKEGETTASELATSERVRPQSMAKIVGSLETAGMVSRRPDPEDGRRQLVSLTPQGRAYRTDTRRAAVEWLTRALEEHCTEEERQALLASIAVLDAVAQS